MSDLDLVAVEVEDLGAVRCGAVRSTLLEHGPGEIPASPFRAAEAAGLETHCNNSLYAVRKRTLSIVFRNLHSGPAGP